MHRSAIALLLAGLLPTSYLLAQECSSSLFAVESDDGEVYLEVTDDTVPVADFYVPTHFNDEVSVQGTVLQHFEGELLVDGVPVATLPVTEIAAGAVGEEQIANGAVTNSKFEGSSVMTSHFQDQSVTANKMSSDSVTSRAIKDGSVNNDKLADDSVVSDSIANGTIKPVDVQNDAITSLNVKDGTIQGQDIADQTITSVNIVPGTITAAEIKDETISTSNFDYNTITSDKIMDGTILGKNLFPATITTREIAHNTVKSTNILDRTISSQDIADNAIDTIHIKAAAVNSYHIENGSIQDEDLNDGIITSAKIIDGSIQAQDVAAKTITDDELAIGSVTSEEILDGTILTRDIGYNAVTGTVIGDGQVKTEDIANDTIHGGIIDAISTEDLADRSVTTEKMEYIHSWHMSYNTNENQDTASAIPISATVVKLNNDDSTHSIANLEDDSVEQAFIAICQDDEGCEITDSSDSLLADLLPYTINIVYYHPSSGIEVTSMRSTDDSYASYDLYTKADANYEIDNVDIYSRNAGFDFRDSSQTDPTNVDDLFLILGGGYTQQVNVAPGDTYTAWIVCEDDSANCYVSIDGHYDNIPSLHTCLFHYDGSSLNRIYCSTVQDQFDFTADNLVDGSIYGAYLENESINVDNVKRRTSSDPTVTDALEVFISSGTTVDASNDGYYFVECGSGASTCTFRDSTLVHSVVLQPSGMYVVYVSSSEAYYFEFASTIAK